MSTLTINLKKFAKQLLPRRLLILLQNSRNLTKIPIDEHAAISDMFLYRCDDNWNTYFELLNVPGLIEPTSQGKYQVHLVFFDKNGELLYQQTVSNERYKRKTIDLKQIVIENNLPLNGLFSCFHDRAVETILSDGGFLTERGYMGYVNMGISHTKGYVHGNFDAIARYRSGKFLCLGGSFSHYCEYRLQHELEGEADYELSFVNTTSSKQTYKITFIGINGQTETTIFTIPSRGNRVYYKKMGQGERGRIVIISKVNLARPVVFRNTTKSFDVFHG